MKTIKLILYCLVLVSLFSCKKKKEIPEEFSFIEGKWKHNYTLISYQDVNWDLITDTVYPKVDYFIEFRQKGYIDFILNEEIINKSKLKSYSKIPSGIQGIDGYIIDLHKGLFYQLSFYHFPNGSINMGNYPFPHFDSGHPHPSPNGIANYFVKIN